MRRRALAAVLAAAAVASLGAESAMACSCVPPDPEGMLESMDGAIVGRLVAVRAVNPPAEGEPIGSGDPTDYAYRVRRAFKGAGLRRGKRVRVRSVRSEATCGLPRARGRLYGVLLIRRNGRWHSNLCLTVTPRQLRRAARGESAASRQRASCGTVTR